MQERRTGPNVIVYFWGNLVYLRFWKRYQRGVGPFTSWRTEANADVLLDFGRAASSIQPRRFGMSVKRKG